jgi:electron transfer flavoprotein alpha subunit
VTSYTWYHIRDWEHNRHTRCDDYREKKRRVILRGEAITDHAPNPESFEVEQKNVPNIQQITERERPSYVKAAHRTKHLQKDRKDSESRDQLESSRRLLGVGLGGGNAASPHAEREKYDKQNEKQV